MKMLVIGSLPAVCGVSAGSALGEKIAWPDVPSPNLAFPVAPKVAEAPAASSEEMVQAVRLRELQIRAEMELRARQQAIEQVPIFIDGARP